MKTIIVRLAVFGVFAFSLWLGCSEKDDPVSSSSTNNSDTTQNKVTYTNSMKAVFDARCIQCHSTERQGPDRNGAPADVNFNTYEVAAANANRAIVRVQAGTMPPTGGRPQSERDLFQKWIDQGLLE